MRTKHLLFPLLLLLCALSVAMPMASQTSRADYRIVPLPDRIDGVKGADFLLTGNCLINYPTGNREMERSAQMLSRYVEDMTGIHLSIRPTTKRATSRWPLTRR